MHLPPLGSVMATVPGLDAFDDTEILAKVHVRPDDILLLSLAGRRLRHADVDFDFCVVAQEKDDRFFRATFPRKQHMRFYTSADRVKESFDYLPGSAIGVNVEYWTLDEMTEMLDAHHRLYAHMRGRARKSSSFAGSRVDFRMLSRVCYARPLHNADAFGPVLARIDRGQVGYTASGATCGTCRSTGARARRRPPWSPSPAPGTA